MAIKCKVGHDEQSSKLIVAFLPNANGAVAIYEYSNVDQTLFKQLVDASSRGSFFINNIKNNPTVYPFQRITNGLASTFLEILPIEQYGIKKTSIDQQWFDLMSSVKINNTSWCW